MSTIALTFKKHKGLGRFLGTLAKAKPQTFLLPASLVIKKQFVRRIEDEKRAPGGGKWKRWSPTYAATRSAGHSIGIDTREMLNTIRRRFSGDRADIFADAPHAPHFARVRPLAGFNQKHLREVERAFVLRLEGMLETAFG